MKKTPWDVFAWICVELAFFLTLGIVAAYVLLNAVAGATSGNTGLFGSWWQVLLFIADIIVVFGAVFFFYMHFRKKAALKERKRNGGGKK